MNIIKFPGLNLEFNISNVAIKIFGIEIYWYAIIMVSAFIIGILLCKKRDGLYVIKFSDILDLMLFLIPISIISARIYFVIFNLQTYITNPIQILNIRNGGMAIYGGVIGGIITTYIFCKKRKINFLDLLDYLAPALILGQAIGRWGNFINIEAYGYETTIPWRMGIIEEGKYIEVHPTFLYESILNFIIFIVLLLIKDKRKFKGQVTYLYLILYPFVRAIIENLRTDSLMLGNFRISQILSIIVFVIFVILYTYKNVVTHKKKKE